METQKSRKNTFLLRIWHESDTNSALQSALWRAQVQHVQSGKNCYVDEITALIEFIEQQTGNLIHDATLPTDLK